MYIKKTVVSQSLLLNHYIFKIRNVESLAKAAFLDTSRHVADGKELLHWVR